MSSPDLAQVLGTVRTAVERAADASLKYFRTELPSPESGSLSGDGS